MASESLWSALETDLFLARSLIANGALVQREIEGHHLWKDSHQSEDIILFPQTKAIIFHETLCLCIPLLQNIQHIIHSWPKERMSSTLEAVARGMNVCKAAEE